MQRSFQPKNPNYSALWCVCAINYDILVGEPQYNFSVEREKVKFADVTEIDFSSKQLAVMWFR